jgi:hypothetical protein
MYFIPAKVKIVDDLQTSLQPPAKAGQELSQGQGAYVPLISREWRNIGVEACQNQIHLSLTGDFVSVFLSWYTAKGIIKTAK